MDSGREILKAVGDLGEGEPAEFVAGFSSGLVFAVAHLPPADREAYLAHVEGGGLRQSVARFLGAVAAGLPKLGNGIGSNH